MRTTTPSLTPNTANQQVAAFVASATTASFAARVGGSTATPNALGRGVTGYMGHSRMFTNVRQNMRAAGYRANGTWPALTLAQWQAVYGVQANLGLAAPVARQAAAQARVGKVLAAASKAQGAPLPRSVLPPLQTRATAATVARHAAAGKAQAGKGKAAPQAAQAAPQAAQAAPQAAPPTGQPVQ